MNSRYENSGEDRHNTGSEKNSGGQKRRKSGGAGNVITVILLIVAVGVFSFSAWKLLGYYSEYKAGTDEYDRLNEKYVSTGSGETGEKTAEDAGENVTAETGTGTETEIDEDGIVRKVKPGKLLANVEELEDPKTLESEVASAAAKETEENGETKMLPMLVNPIDFDELNQVNDEIIGWLRIGALDLSYPVAQASDNAFYLHRTFEKQDNFAGCIFLNCDNSHFFTDQNSIIYGHNMKNGSMFGTLSRFKSQDVYDENPYFWIFTPKLIYQYKIFSCSVVSKQGDPYRTRFTTDEFASFISTSQENSYVDNHGMEVTTDDRIVTLSTCTGDESTRFIVQGVLAQIYISRQGVSHEETE